MYMTCYCIPDGHVKRVKRVLEDVVRIVLVDGLNEVLHLLLLALCQNDELHSCKDRSVVKQGQVMSLLCHTSHHIQHLPSHGTHTTFNIYHSTHCHIHHTSHSTHITVANLTNISRTCPVFPWTILVPSMDIQSSSPPSPSHY